MVRRIIFGSIKTRLKNGAGPKYSGKAKSTKETHVTAYPFHTLP
jgi:hypothetical protein